MTITMITMLITMNNNVNNMKNVVAYSNVHKFASINLTYNLKKIKNLHYKKHTKKHNIFLLLFPPHVQIEADLLNGGPCPSWRSCKSSSYGEACNTQASCVC